MSSKIIVSSCSTNIWSNYYKFLQRKRFQQRVQHCKQNYINDTFQNLLNAKDEVTSSHRNCGLRTLCHRRSHPPHGVQEWWISRESSWPWELAPRHVPQAGPGSVPAWWQGRESSAEKVLLQRDDHVQRRQRRRILHQKKLQQQKMDHFLGRWVIKFTNVTTFKFNSINYNNRLWPMATDKMSWYGGTLLAWYQLDQSYQLCRYHRMVTLKLSII